MSIYTGSNSTVTQLFDILEADSGSFNEMRAKLAAADGDVDKAREAWLDSTDNAQVAKLRAAIEKANQQLAELAEKNVSVETLSEDDRKALEESIKAMRTRVRDGRTLILDLAKQLNNDVEGVSKALEEYPDVTRGARVGSAGAKTGSSLPRVSVDINVTGGTFTEEAPGVYKSFSFLAKDLHTDVESLQKAFAEAAGVEHSEISGVKRDVEFKFQAAEGGSVYTISTTPKKNEKPGPKASA